MLHHHVAVMYEFLDEQPASNAHPGKHSKHPDGAEKVQRAPKIFEQESNRDQIEEDAERPRNTVVRGAPLAVDVANGHFADRSSMPRCQRWDEAMQFTVKRNLLKNIATIGLERGAEIVDVHAAKFCHHPVGAA